MDELTYAARRASASQPKSDQPAPPLTDREREVLALIAAGSTNREIAERLYLSPHTVKEHTSALYRKLEARNRAEILAHGLGGKLGRMRSSSQGVYQVTPRDSTDVSDYGINDTSSREKDVNAVVSATFAVNR